MGVFEFLVILVVLSVAAVVVCWLLKKISGVPDFVYGLVWIVVGFVLVMLLLKATGVLGLTHDVAIPKVH